MQGRSTQSFVNLYQDVSRFDGLRKELKRDTKADVIVAMRNSLEKGRVQWSLHKCLWPWSRVKKENQHCYFLL